MTAPDAGQPSAEARDELLLEVAQSGVEFDDPRIDYVTVQIDRVTWDALRALLSAPPAGGPPAPETEV